jgi:hypothetical protein
MARQHPQRSGYRHQTGELIQPELTILPAFVKASNEMLLYIVTHWEGQNPRLQAASLASSGRTD